VGWQANAPLAVGSKLSLLAKAQAYPSAVQSQLTVVGPPTELTAEKLAFGEWLTFGHGVGDLVTCASLSGTCGAVPISLPGNEETLRAVQASWAPPSINGFVAWEAHVELPDGVEMVQPTAPQWLFRTSSDPFNLGMLVFPKATTEYCGELVVKDVRTGKELRSKLCQEPRAAMGATVRDYGLASCSAPPTPALKQAWCETHADDALCSGSPGDPMPQDPILQDPQDPMPQGPNPERPAEPNAETDDAAAEGSRTSSGCQMGRGVPATSGFALLLTLGGLAAVWQRRQRSRRG
jgi:hypothetical protein